MKKKYFVFTMLAVIVLIVIVLAGCENSATRTSDNMSATTGRPHSRTSIPKSTGALDSANQTTSSTEPQIAVKPQAPVPAEVNPPGDIPDNQVFIPYKSVAGGFQVKVPEGWAQSTSKSAVSFSDKLNKIDITWEPSAAAPTVNSARTTDVALLSKTELAFQLRSVKQVTLPGGDAILITYRVNSQPNQVTSKQYRLDVLRYELFKNGTKANITLSSPVGADNVDPWNIVSRSFLWQR